PPGAARELPESRPGRYPSRSKERDQLFCLVPALFPSALLERSSKRFSPLRRSLPLLASTFFSSFAAACLRPRAASFPLAVGASFTPMALLPDFSAAFLAA